MKKIYSIIILAAALISLIPLSTSCKKDDGNAVELEVFGPCPVLRGSTISFIGKNLDRVTSITFPNAIEVTEITKTSSTEIIAPVPQEATEGKLILNYPGGSITTTSSIGFTEPYEITSISPTDKAIRCGDIVTISGDYLWNIVSVVFMSAAEVDSSLFTSQTRTQISVPVPADAQSGKIKIVDASGNELYSDAELIISQPTVTAVAPLEVKAGNEITLTGTNLDLIESVTFTSNKEVVIELPERSQTSVKVSVPVDAQDGKISYKSYAGISSEFGTAITMVVPSGLSVTAPEGFKADKLIVIAGKDLDLVTAVTFSGNVDGTYTYLPEDGTIIVPIDPAAQDGVITLTTAAGKTVETEAVTFVKPVITSMNPLALTAGETFKVIGTDLDLTDKLSLGGKECTYTIDSDTQLTVQTENTSVSGKVTITTANGVTAESADEIILSYESLVIVTDMPTTAGIDDEITVTGANFNIIENIYFGDVKVTGYTSRTDSELKFRIPDVQTGSYNMRFVLFNGDEETCPKPIDITGRVTLITLWEGSHDLGGAWGNALQNYDGSKYANLFANTPITIEFTENEGTGWWQLQIMDGTWTKLVGPGHEGDVVNLESGQTSFTFTTTFADMKQMKASGLVINGCNVTISKIYASITNLSPDKVNDTDVMLMDFQKHGNHDGTWDGSWSGISEIVNDNDNLYWRSTAAMTSGVWVLNCNHQADGALGPVIPNLSNYIMKVDVKLENDILAGDATSMSIIFNGQWNGWINDFFADIKRVDAYSTNGCWVTLSFPADSFGYSSMDCSTGDYGMFYQGAAMDAVGICFDNWRFEHK